jgi:hypothetical protein
LKRKRGLKGLKEPTLSGHTLQPTNKVRYLGPILGKGLIWKSTAENVIRPTGLFGPV